jgi:hypothetical protein
MKQCCKRSMIDVEQIHDECWLVMWKYNAYVMFNYKNKLMNIIVCG